MLDHPADRVVRQSPVQGLDELGGGEVADTAAGVDGVVSEGDEQVALARPGGSHETKILLGGDPLERHQVVERGTRDRRGVDVELVERLFDREGGGGQAASRVRRVARGDLGFDQGAQELLGAPALGLGHHQQFGSEAAYGTEAQAAEPGFEVGGERRWRGAHTSPPMA